MANATKEQMPEVVAIFIARMPGIFWTLLTSYLRMKKQSKLAGKEFYRVLVDNGIPPGMARELRDEYSNMVSITTLIRSRGIQK
jgi:hypothetical protein